MKILFIGDIFGKVGRRMVEAQLPTLIANHKPDVVIANAENTAHGKGVRQKDIDFFRACGIHVLTGGNHTFDNKDIFSIVKDDPYVLRPHNYPEGTAGTGVCRYKDLLVINLMGRVFMPEGLDSPFQVVDKILEEHMDDSVQGVFVDFHGETTSEKAAMFHYLNGRISTIVGTHTHIQTADERVSDKGTAFISDVGMTGPEDSIIGMETDTVLKKFLTGLPSKFQPANTAGIFAGVLIEIEDMKAKSIERVLIRE